MSCFLSSFVWVSPFAKFSEQSSLIVTCFLNQVGLELGYISNNFNKSQQMLFTKYCHFHMWFRISEDVNLFRCNPYQSLKRVFIISGNNCFAENWEKSLDVLNGLWFNPTSWVSFANCFVSNMKALYIWGCVYTYTHIS